MVDPISEGPRAHGESTVVEMTDLCKWYPVYREFPPAWLQRRPARYVKAVDGVTLQVKEGEVLGLAGESGSGKSTTAELLIRLQDPTGGSIRYGGESIEGIRGAALRAFRRRVQMVVQDPYQALNPHFTVRAIVEEPLIIHGIGSKSEREAAAVEALGDVGLRPVDRYLDRHPHELSGGERQRVCVARALVLRPEFLILDEPTSMLDVSLRAGLLNLLQRLSGQYRLTMLIISHDLGVLRYMCDRIAIMYRGRIAEIGATSVVAYDPLHPYTRALISAIPNADPRVRRARTDLTSDLDESAPEAPGCPFEPRCKFRQPACQKGSPPLVSHRGRELACVMYGEE